MSQYKLYTDGSYEKHLGIASIGGQLLDYEDNVIFKFSERIEDPNSYKYHESIAMLHGLNLALKHGVTELECYSDEKSIADNFNKKNYNPNESKAILNHPYKIKIAALIDKFSYINFNYLPRLQNKQADKLAGKSLKDHKHKVFQLKKRKAFIGQEDKLLYVPNLICEEDYQEPGTNMHDFSIKRKELINYYLVDIAKDKTDLNNAKLIIKYYQIEKNPKDHKNIFSSLLKTQEINQKDLFLKVAEELTTIFNDSNIHGNVGLMFKGDNFLRYPEMILRKRATLHKPNTELIQDFINAANKFSEICLHNDEKLIKTHDLLIDNPKFDKINKIISRNKP